MTRSDTSHIEACGNAWLKHWANCCQCGDFSVDPIACEPCDEGRILYDEYRSAITANRDCEHLEAKAAE